MARSCVKRVALLTVLLAGVASGTTAPAADSRVLAPELDYAQLDYQRGRLQLRDVTIRQDQMRIQADVAEATGLDFSDSNWTFSGKVVVHMPEGEMHAAQAVVKFAAGRIVSATADGAPATFAQQPAADNPGARGRAARISYDIASGDVQLEGEAWLNDQNREISGRRIIYSIPQRSFRADSGEGGEKVRGTIRLKPPEGAPSGATQ